MALDDREYYREELCRKRGVRFNSWLPPSNDFGRLVRQSRAAEQLQDAFLARQAAAAELEETITVDVGQASRWWLVAAACVFCAFAGYVAGALGF
jgi:hypothetical protein